MQNTKCFLFPILFSYNYITDFVTKFSDDSWCPINKFTWSWSDDIKWWKSWHCNGKVLFKAICINSKTNTLIHQLTYDTRLPQQCAQFRAVTTYSISVDDDGSKVQAVSIHHGWSEWVTEVTGYEDTLQGRSMGGGYQSMPMAKCTMWGCRTALLRSTGVSSHEGHDTRRKRKQGNGSVFRALVYDYGEVRPSPYLRRVRVEECHLWRMWRCCSWSKPSHLFLQSNGKYVSASTDDIPPPGPSSNKRWVSLPHNHPPWPWRQDVPPCSFLPAIGILRTSSEQFCLITLCTVSIGLDRVCLLGAAALPREDTWYPLYRSMVGPQGWSRGVWKISPLRGSNLRLSSPQQVTIPTMLSQLPINNIIFLFCEKK
jgi:hypothetical protein